MTLSELAWTENLELSWTETDRNPTITNIDERNELNEKIMKETRGATSLAYSGPTTVGAATTLRKLYFPCQGAACDLYPLYPLLLNLLMPTLADDKRKDLCLACFNTHMNVNMSTMAFIHQVPHLRLAEKWQSPQQMTWTTHLWRVCFFTPTSP